MKEARQPAYNIDVTNGSLANAGSRRFPGPLYTRTQTSPTTLAEVRQGPKVDLTTESRNAQVSRPLSSTGRT